MTPPAYGETPVSIITTNAQFSGTVSWNSSPSKFAANTVYTATIELTAKSGYTLEGVSGDFFEVSGASVVTNDADSGIITAEFPATGSAPPAVVNIKAISGVTAPVKDAVPVTSITETAQYTGTISWSGSPAKFAASTVYTATITLTAKTGYTFNGISANYFTVSGTTTATNNADSGVITAVFPKTNDVPPLTEVTVESTTTITFGTGTEFKIITTPDISTTNTFPCNIDGDGYFSITENFDDEDTDIANVPSRFMMGETEVTYELWYEVYMWATIDAGNGKRADGGVLYSFANKGYAGSFGDEDPEAHTTAKKEPVAHINWRDTIVWCNALTEYYNAYNGSEPDLSVVYCSDTAFTTPIRNSEGGKYWGSVNTAAGSYDNPYLNISAKGFRLPNMIEWEFAGRYIGVTEPSHTNYILRDGIYYSAGYCASGAVDGHYDDDATEAVAVYDVWKTTNVKTKAPNALGLYDMSGNVFEFCFDWHPKTPGFGRVMHGGAYHHTHNRMQLGWTEYFPPYYKYENFGFRFCKSR